MILENEHSTKHALLVMLRTKGPLTVAEMAKQLGITEMAVRSHLNMMDRDGLLATKISRQAMGRPTHLYSLTDHADHLFPKNYHMLTLDLLDELAEEEDGQAMVERLFERRQARLVRKYKETMAGKSLPERVETLADIQNQNGYMADWSEGESGEYVLNEFNCPITQVAAKYHVACSCELKLFRNLLDADVERTECMTAGGAKCSYRIKSKRTEPAETD